MKLEALNIMIYWNGASAKNIFLDADLTFEIILTFLHGYNFTEDGTKSKNF